MKLHKLLYFTQREAIIQTGAPMFEDCFEARQYGPVMASVRYQFMNSQLNEQLSDDALNSYKSVFDSVFDLYANKSSWDLSMLSHSEQSWINARNRMKPNADCEELMLTEFLTTQDQILRMSGIEIALPFVFTEQGITQLSAVLHSDQEIEVSIQIHDAFHARMQE